jgi:hypothetical protein
VKPSVEVARISGDISDAVAGFFRKVWTQTATGDSVRRARAEAARLERSLRSPTLRLVLADPARRAALGEAAAARANRDSTVAVMAERYEVLYANAHSKRQRTALRARAM